MVLCIFVQSSILELDRTKPNFFTFFNFLLINKYTKHKLTIIRCQSQRLIWRRSESYNVLLSYNDRSNSFDLVRASNSQRSSVFDFVRWPNCIELFCSIEFDGKFVRFRSM